jgi:hypothetical protein
MLIDRTCVEPSSRSRSRPASGRLAAPVLSTTDRDLNRDQNRDRLRHRCHTIEIDGASLQPE